METIGSDGKPLLTPSVKEGNHAWKEFDNS